MKPPQEKPAYRFIERHRNGWRAWASVDGRRTRGPRRETQAEAHADALEMRRRNACPDVHIYRVLRACAAIREVG